MKEGITNIYNGSVNFYNGATQNGDVHITNPTYNNHNTPGGFNPRMPHHLSQRQATFLCQLLKNESFLAPEQNVEKFCYVMGCIELEVENYKPIKWMKNVQLLRELLESIYRDLIENKALSKADLVRCVPRCFIDEKNTPITLANNKNRDETPDSRSLTKILATFVEQKDKY